MKTTTQIVDDEFEYLRDKSYIEAERYERELELMQEIFEMEHVKILLGKVRKHRKNVQHATVTTRAKLPRFVRIQSNNRRLQATADIWNRFESSVHIGMLI